MNNVYIIRNQEQRTADDLAEQLEKLAASIRSGEKKVSDYIVLFSAPDAAQILDRCSAVEAFYMLEFAMSYFRRRSKFHE